ncbi:putative C2H2 finger domain protein [Aspergillus homomorphus CBS 101889]|uniref:C2H2 finger domain protein n=1 Tax=Aspergillus homomorphus (strain CBS 101889) TaxID=1450537 RepID=A0A395HJS7_ASPHC|nr:C2H2 finger domain protein [Aspergillus homomorphus CBS 101889]RAL07445.1 C2H2 finger domain protein [Aspergillus homomorphus CBS 101889]
MSALSPQLVQDDSPTGMSFHDANFSDPYLSAPVDPDEASFKSSAIRLTPANEDDHGATLPASPLFVQIHKNEDLEVLNEGPEASYSDFLSPTDDFSSDLSAHASPSADLIPARLAVDGKLGLGVWQHDHALAPSVPGPEPVGNGATSSQSTAEPSQMVTTSNSDIFLESSSVQNETRLGATSRTPQPLSLNTNAPTRARSPIVKIESYSRGDSPARDASPIGRRRSLSSTHLTPDGPATDSEPEDSRERIIGLSPGYSPITRTHNGSWLPNAGTGQAGVEPPSRADIYISSPNELEAWRRLEEKNADIQSWSASVSAANSDAEDETPLDRGRKRHVGVRRRAKSAGDPSLQQDHFSLKSQFLEPVVPGPGLLLHESSDGELSDYRSGDESTSDSPAINANEAERAKEGLETLPSTEQDRLEDEDPSPHQFLKAPPWQDTDCDSAPRSTRVQPQSSSAAMVEYQRRAKDLDSASRAATWGTRHLLDADVYSVIGPGGSFESLSISNGKNRKHERRSSLRKYLPRNPSHHLKRRLSDLSIMSPSADSAGKGDELTSPPMRKDSFPHRKLSLGRSRSPSLSTGGAVIAIAGQMAAIGGKDSLRVASPNSTLSPWPTFKGRGRSRSELPRASSPGLIDLMTSHGGPPVPNIGYSPRVIDRGVHLQGAPKVGQATDDADDENDDLPGEKGLVMQFPVQSRLPVPTLDGFKSQITELNPRLPPALVERFAQEQLRRYRKLVDSKQNHLRDLGAQKCASGSFCFAQGGEAKLFAPRVTANDPDASYTQFNISARNEADDDAQKPGESTVTAAQFPSGVPLPPVKRLPAEFECPICFQVKKFQKPSDWTKHVHEDVQPFTCTFPHCTEPKSFKRKADWVRHESERHRKLEWWTCTVPDCHHTCYRKDNFVQHLVREHKMPEPKIKKARNPGSGRKRNDSVTLAKDAREDSNFEHEIEQLWELVEGCRHDTPRGPKDEPCRFCGNVCSSWKKLTVHLAKHMEQIAMPVLGLVNERDLSPNGSVSANGKPNTYGPEPLSISHESTPFPSQSNGMDITCSDETMNATQAPYASNNADRQNSGESLMASNPICSPSPMTMPSGWIFAEPESIDAYHEMPPAGHFSSLPEGTADQSRFMATHQNSVTYPPPFNTGPRVRVVNPESSVLQDSYRWTMSPTESQPTFAAQSSVYSSPSAENRHGLLGSMTQTYPFARGGYGEQL